LRTYDWSGVTQVASGTSGITPAAGDFHAEADSVGWSTFEHRFYNAGLGVLAVEMRITTLSGSPLHSWTLSDPTDIIGTTVGGHRYGWVVIQEFPILAIDNAGLLSINVAGGVAACKNDGWQQFTRADGSLFKNQGDCIQYVNTGK
jgi:hypothetical protein